MRFKLNPEDQLVYDASISASVTRYTKGEQYNKRLGSLKLNAERVEKRRV